ncbi:hypothetical protein ACIHFD_67540 [Nonomuraea sp. NPDC051941]|uniref:hypothetical protein n=1 Tax=Nonomuraea sp. NPDC051941 TaxID=3364373 RepID=UPI0037CB86B5
MGVEAWSAIAAGVSAIGAVAAVMVALFAWSTTKHAARATADLTKIEARRWHHDLTPQFTIEFAEQVGDQAVLKVWFNGPTALAELRVGLTIRNDKPRSSRLAGGPSPDEIAAQVWGPYRFRPRVDGADELGRTTGPVKLLPGDGRQFTLERTIEPRWTTPEWWRDEYENAPVRVGLRCTTGDYEPWTVYYEVPTVQGEPLEGQLYA